MLSFIDFEASFEMLFKMIKLAKMPQNLKSSERFRTVFDSAVLCQLFQAPYTVKPLTVIEINKIHQKGALYGDLLF